MDMWDMNMVIRFCTYLWLEKYIDALRVIFLMVQPFSAKTLKYMGFKVNPYDICVANKTKNGK